MINPLAAIALVLSILMGDLFIAHTHAQGVTEIGGEKIVTLIRTPTSQSNPEFSAVTLAPGRGMELIQITANFPGLGEVNVLASPSLAEAKEMLDDQDDANGDLGYRLGAAFLVPYPNRIIGKVSADGKTVTTHWKGHTLVLPANNVGKVPGAERNAIHGLIHKAKTDNVQVKDIPGGQEVTGVIHAGDFGGHWLSKTNLDFTITLKADAIDTIVVAHNVGNEAEPIAIGWHPYFNLPSGDREQVKLHIPGFMLTRVNNYDSVFPTGELLPVSGQYDLQAPGGKLLDKNFYDDNWSHLEWKNGAVTVILIDPAAHYCVKIEGLSPEIKTIQAYASPTAKFVAVEDQFNFVNPFGKEWGKMNTGMINLKPGQSTRWHVRLRVFVP